MQVLELETVVNKLNEQAKKDGNLLEFTLDNNIIVALSWFSIDGKNESRIVNFNVELDSFPDNVLETYTSIIYDYMVKKLIPKVVMLTKEQYDFFNSEEFADYKKEANEVFKNMSS